jgi:hypothetical protein
LPPGGGYAGDRARDLGVAWQKWHNSLATWWKSMEIHEISWQKWDFNGLKPDENRRTFKIFKWELIC